MRRIGWVRMWLAVAFMSVGAGCAASGAHPRKMVVAAVSFESKIAQVDKNLEQIELWSRRAADAGADLVLLPETALSAWWSSREIRRHGEPIDGPSIRRLIRLADELDLVIAVGMTERDGDRAYITQVVLDGRGVIGRHRKSSLAPGEEKTWDPGDDANVFTIRGARVGIAICYESVQPGTCAKLKANGAEIILAPYANGTLPEELVTDRREYPYARARENHVWYVACDAPLRDGEGRLHQGAAYVISPEGRLMALTSPEAPKENMIVYTLRLDGVPGAAR